MTQPEKFLFDESFDGELSEHGRAAKKPKAPTFSEDDLAAVEQRGFDAGRSAGLDEAGRSAEERIASCLETLAAQIGELDEQVTQAQEQHERETLKLACHVLGKMFPVLAQRGALVECEHVIESSLARLRNEPRVVLRTADHLHDLLRDRIEALGQRTGFEGRIVLLSDEELGPSDVRVEWADGGAERNTADLWSEIETMIARTFDVPIPPREAVPQTEMIEPELPSGAQANPGLASLAASA